MLTLILLSHDNLKYLPRVLEYYKIMQFKGRIFILDSSAYEIKKEVRAIIAQFKSDLFSPQFIDCDPTFSFAQQLQFVMGFVSTPYVLFASLDDFFSVQGIYEILSFMKDNEDYIFVHGYSYGFTFINGHIDWYFIGDIDIAWSIESKDAFERIDIHLKQPIATAHSIFKRAELDSILKECAIYVSDPYGKFYENMLTLLALLKGKGKFLPIPFSWREMSNNSGGAVNHERWLLDDNFESNKKSMEKGLQLYLQQDFLLSHEEAQKKAQSICDRWITVCFFSIYPFSHSSKRTSLWNLMKWWSPAYLVEGFRWLRRNYKDFRRYKVSGEWLLCDIASPYFRELKLIKSLIISSNIITYRDGMEDYLVDRARFQNSDHV